MGSSLIVRPISAGDATPVADFLCRHLNPRLSPGDWLPLIAPPWGNQDAPNHGFQLLDGDEVVGAYIAVYSVRTTQTAAVPVCNLAAFCVRDDHRGHALRLVRAMLKQPGYEFTDLSPSGSVIALNERMGFVHLDATTSLVGNLPGIVPGGVTVSGASGVMSDALTGRDAEIYRDHLAAPAARHVLVQREGAYAYLMFRRSTRKRLPWFAAPLHVGGDPGLLQRAWPGVAAHLLVRHRLPFTLAEERVLGFLPKAGVRLQDVRPKMALTKQLAVEDVDYLYSELTLLEW